MDIKTVGTLPQYMEPGAAGADLSAAFGYDVEPGDQVMISTDTKVEIPFGFFGMLVPRSSICIKGNMVLQNSVGIIDSSFRGEIRAVYRNLGSETVHISRGERIGQLVIVPYVPAHYVPSERLSDTERGEGGFGSTGLGSDFEYTASIKPTVDVTISTSNNTK